MKLTDKETYLASVEYGKYKATLKFWKILLLGFMGGAFVALGYLGAFAMKSFGDAPISKFLGAAIFPTGIIMCVFLGGSLFTSDSLSILPVVEKQIKPLTAAKGLALVWIGNLVGGMFIAGIATLSGFFYKDATHEKLHILQHYIDGKQDKDWYKIFFSGVLTNMLVAGSVWMSLATKSAGAKVVLLWFPITLFAAAGFEHIVANFFIFFSGLFNDGLTWKEGADSHILHIDGWKFFYNNLLPTTVGNWVGGAVIIALPYYFMNRSK